MIKTLKEDIGNELKKNRPNLTTSSIKTYVSSLFNLDKQMKGDMKIEWFSKNEKEILEYLSTKQPRLRKGTLSALFILTGIDAYREKMISDCKTTNDEYKEQKKTQKETDNWVTTEDIREKFEEMKKRIDTMIEAKMIHNNSFIQFLLFALLSGVYIPPRRALDYALLKVRNYDENTDNYLKKGVLYFNQYKTAKKYGQQKVKLPKELLDYMKVWIKNMNNDYLFFGRTDKHLNSPQICKILNGIFHKNVSVDMLRHIYLTNYYKDIPKLKEMEALAENMGNSIATQLHQYVKKE